jgi:hypothetical protein
MPLNNDDDYIKRPINSFMLWAKEMRPYIIKSNPNVINTEISIILGQLWLNMTDKQKEIYYKKAEELKIEHIKLYPYYKYTPQRHKEENKKEKHKEIEEIEKQDEINYINVNIDIDIKTNINNNIKTNIKNKSISRSRSKIINTNKFKLEYYKPVFITKQKPNAFYENTYLQDKRKFTNAYDYFEYIIDNL